MAEPEASRLVNAGRVGRAHGLDGSFTVRDPQVELAVGDQVTLGGRLREVVRRSGTVARPLLRLAGIEDRNAAAAFVGELLLVEAPEPELAEDEWLAEDLIGCRVGSLGTVVGVITGESCDVLELESGVLVPLISDAVHSIDVEGQQIDVDEVFLGIDGDAGAT